jgi:PBP1b-binding outer membrane lipoprotein LpoB
MSTIKIILAIVLIFVLVSCSTSTPTPTSPPKLIPTPTTPVPDVPIYRNSFEGVTDLAASGITSSNANIKITTENVDFASGN